MLIWTSVNIIYDRSFHNVCACVLKILKSTFKNIIMPLTFSSDCPGYEPFFFISPVINLF